MFEKIYLHIGCEKTGTTYVQRFLSSNRSNLKKQGFYYPQSIGKFNHFDLSVFCLDNSKITPLRKLKGVHDETSLNETRKFIEENFYKEVLNEGRDCDVMILSSEQLSSNISLESEVERLLCLLRPLTKSIEFCCYLRRQDDLALSSYSTQVKAGSTAYFNFASIPVEHNKFNFKNMLQTWSSGFPKKDQIIRIYDRASLLNSDVLDDFCSLIGLDIMDLQRPKIVNPSLDIHAIELLRRMNYFLPKFGESGNKRGDIQEVLSSISGPEKLNFKNEDRLILMKKFEACNHWVFENYFSSEKNNPLRLSLNNDKVASSYDEAKIAEYTAKMWMKKQDQILNILKTTT